MAALLNSLQMGFQTLAIQKRSSEVWQVLAGVKAEFDTFAQALLHAQSRIRQADSELENLLGVQLISYDKVNQLRHVKYLKDKAVTLEIMKRHASLMAPKFQMVLEVLDREIAPLGFAQWNKPKGGYFVSLNTMPGTAKRALALCKEAGVVMTDAGATYPYGIDPQDTNIRIAPSLPPVAELEQAMEVFCLCLKIAAFEKELGL
jgi:DNA-binding transcriptional MocR family regulator